MEVTNENIFINCLTKRQILVADDGVDTSNIPTLNDSIKDGTQVVIGSANSFKEATSIHDTFNSNNKITSPIYANRNDMYYVDICTALKDDLGKLPDADAENDGLHLKYSAYEKLIDYVLTHTAK